MALHPINIFYSWQADLPNSVNRGFIEDALQRAADQARMEPVGPIEFSAAVDRDTRGRLGSPDIAATIFAKIDVCDIFVCDVSIINSVGAASPKMRLAPNPNVMAELGYAAGKLGWDRVICVCNESYGSVEALPFDLRGRLLIAYDARPGHPKAEQRKVLISKLKAALAPLYATAWQAHRPHPLRFAAYEDTAGLANSLLHLLSAMHQNSRAVQTEDDWPTILSRRQFDETLAWTNPDWPLTFAGGEQQPLGHFVAIEAGKARRMAGRQLQRYSDKLDPLLYEALHNLEGSPLLGMLERLPDIQALDAKKGGPKRYGFQAYCVATDRDLRALLTLAEWCARERAALVPYDPDVRELEPPSRGGTPGIWRVVVGPT